MTTTEKQKRLTHIFLPRSYAEESGDWLHEYTQGEMDDIKKFAAELGYRISFTDYEMQSLLGNNADPTRAKKVLDWEKIRQIKHYITERVPAWRQED